MKMRVTINDQSFEVEISDLNCRPILATIEGEQFEVWPEEAGCIPAAVPTQPAQPAPSPVTTIQPTTQVNSSKSVTAPIPGTIIAVLVKEGQMVTYGQELVTLEAMKMKNAIIATREGEIGVIHVKVGDQVRHSQVLVDYAD